MPATLTKAMLADLMKGNASVSLLDCPANGQVTLDGLDFEDADQIFTLENTLTITEGEPTQENTRIDQMKEIIDSMITEDRALRPVLQCRSGCQHHGNHRPGRNRLQGQGLRRQEGGLLLRARRESEQADRGHIRARPLHDKPPQHGEHRQSGLRLLLWLHCGESQGGRRKLRNRQGSKRRVAGSELIEGMGRFPSPFS